MANELMLLNTKATSKTDLLTASLEQVRQTLPGQIVACRLEEVRLRYGNTLSADELVEQVRQIIPKRLGYFRNCRRTLLAYFQHTIPSTVLARYIEARDSGLFSQFYVYEPLYNSLTAPDPWLVGEVMRSKPPQFVCVAHWE